MAKVNIRVSSQKGGVGKTTISVNLASALSYLGYKVLLVDGNLRSPNLSVCMGVLDSKFTVGEVMTESFDAKDAIVHHDSSGVDVVPGVQVHMAMPEEESLKNVVKKLEAVGDYDFMIMDTESGFIPPEVVMMYNQVVVVSTPTMSSIKSSATLAESYRKANIKYDIVVNRVTNAKYEFSVSDIEKMLDGRPVAILPEDPNVQVSESKHIPIFIYDPKSPFSTAIMDLARSYAQLLGYDKKRLPAGKKEGFIEKLGKDLNPFSDKGA